MQQYTSLKRKTPLKAKTSLTAKTGISQRSTLKAKTDLRRSYATKVKSGEKTIKKRNTVYKPKYPYFSVFTNDLNRCFVTGSTSLSGILIHKHHVFFGSSSNKAFSEKYGFIIPLRGDWHEETKYSVHKDYEFNLRLKRMCQEYWLIHYGTKEEFIKIFGRWW